MNSLFCILIVLTCVFMVFKIIEKFISLYSSIKFSFSYRTKELEFSDESSEESFVDYSNDLLEEFSDEKVEAFRERIEELNQMNWEEMPDLNVSADEAGTEIIFNSFELALDEKYGE